MKKYTKYIFCILCALLMILAIKSIHNKKPLTDVMNAVLAQLPETISVENAANGKTLYLDGKKIGGIIPFNIPEEVYTTTPQEQGKVYWDMLKKAGVKEVDDSSYAKTMSSCLYAERQVWFGNDEQEFMHYLFMAYYSGCDLWFDRTQISAEEEKRIVSGIVVTVE